MNLTTIIIYLLASIGLYYILNIIDKKSNKIILDSTMLSIIYIIIISHITTKYGLLPNCNTIFLIPILELIIRIFITNYITDTNYLISNYNKVKYFLIIITSYLINTKYLDEVEDIIPSGKEVRLLVWIIILLYIYNFLKENFSKLNLKKEEVEFNKNSEYIVTNYARFKNKYHKNITKFKLEDLLYSIMIYENYNRPQLARKVDDFKYKLNNKKRKYGIMQVYSNYPIDDIKSIKISMKKLAKIDANLNKKDTSKIKSILDKYYHSSKITNIILDIYYTIVEFKKI